MPHHVPPFSMFEQFLFDHDSPPCCTLSSFPCRGITTPEFA
jgi:hypothetical protein